MSTQEQHCDRPESEITHAGDSSDLALSNQQLPETSQPRLEIMRELSADPLVSPHHELPTLGEMPQFPGLMRQDGPTNAWVLKIGEGKVIVFNPGDDVYAGRLADNLGEEQLQVCAVFLSRPSQENASGAAGLGAPVFVGRSSEQDLDPGVFTYVPITGREPSEQGATLLKSQTVRAYCSLVPDQPLTAGSYEVFSNESLNRIRNECNNEGLDITPVASGPYGRTAWVVKKGDQTIVFTGDLCNTSQDGKKLYTAPPGSWQNQEYGNIRYGVQEFAAGIGRLIDQLPEDAVIAPGNGEIPKGTPSKLLKNLRERLEEWDKFQSRFGTKMENSFDTSDLLPFKRATQWMESAPQWVSDTFRDIMWGGEPWAKEITELDANSNRTDRLCHALAFRTTDKESGRAQLVLVDYNLNGSQQDTERKTLEELINWASGGEQGEVDISIVISHPDNDHIEGIRGLRKRLDSYGFKVRGLTVYCGPESRDDLVTPGLRLTLCTSESLVDEDFTENNIRAVEKQFQIGDLSIALDHHPGGHSLYGYGIKITDESNGAKLYHASDSLCLRKVTKNGSQPETNEGEFKTGLYISTVPTKGMRPDSYTKIAESIHSFLGEGNGLITGGHGEIVYADKDLTKFIVNKLRELDTLNRGVAGDNCLSYRGLDCEITPAKVTRDRINSGSFTLNVRMDRPLWLSEGQSWEPLFAAYGSSEDGWNTKSPQFHSGGLTDRDEETFSVTVKLPDNFPSEGKHIIRLTVMVGGRLHRLNYPVTIG